MKKAFYLCFGLALVACSDGKQVAKGNLIGQLFSQSEEKSDVAGLPPVDGDQIIAHEIPQRESRYMLEIPVDTKEMGHNNANNAININPLPMVGKAQADTGDSSSVVKKILDSVHNPMVIKDEQIQKQFLTELSQKPPRYAVGDYYKFSNPNSVWTVVDIKAGIITWKSDGGAMQKTYDNPLLPALEWTSKANGTGRRFISNRQGIIFPMVKDNKYSFMTSVDSDETGASFQYAVQWNCVIDAEFQAMQTKVGKHWVFRHICNYGSDTKEKASQMVFYYAPAIGHYVVMEILDASKKNVQRRELLEFSNMELAKATQNLPVTKDSDFQLADFNKYSVVETEVKQPVVNQFAVLQADETNGLTNIKSNIAPIPAQSKTNPGVILPPQPAVKENTQKKLFSDPAYDNSVAKFNPNINPETYVLDNDNIPKFNPAIKGYEGQPGVRERIGSDIHALKPFDESVYNDVRLGKGPKAMDPQGLILQQPGGKSLNGTPREQAEALLAKRYGNRISPSKFAETGDENDTTVLAQPKVSDKLNGFFNQPTKAIRPNRFVEADTQNDPLLPPNNFGSRPLEYEQDKLSKEEYFKRQNPAYRQYEQHAPTEQERLSTYQYKSSAAEPDQLAGSRGAKPVDYFNIQTARGSQKIETLEQIQQLKLQQLQREQQQRQLEQNPLTRPEDRYAQLQSQSQNYALKLASFQNKNQAINAWNQLTQNYPGHFKGLEPAVQEATANNKPILNLFAVGINKASAAMSICQNLQKIRINCEVFEQ